MHSIATVAQLNLRHLRNLRFRSGSSSPYSFMMKTLSS